MRQDHLDLHPAQQVDKFQGDLGQMKRGLLVRTIQRDNLQRLDLSGFESAAKFTVTRGSVVFPAGEPFARASRMSRHR
jgi:hypothetical protein